MGTPAAVAKAPVDNRVKVLDATIHNFFSLKPNRAHTGKRCPAGVCQREG